MNANLARFRYLLNHGAGFLPGRDTWEEVMKLGNQLADELETARIAGDAESERAAARLAICPAERMEVQ